MPCFAKAASRAAAARQQRDRPTEQARRIKAELASLHVVSSFAAPSSHLYHAADTTTPRPPGGTDLPWGSPLRHVSAGLGTSIVNVLGQPQRLPLPALSTTRAGFPMQESVRAIMARGGATSASVLPTDSEIRLYEASKGSLADRAAMTQGTAAEIMSRDTCVAAARRLLLDLQQVPLHPLSPPSPFPSLRSVNTMLKLTAEKPINSTHRQDFPLHSADTYRKRH